MRKASSNTWHLNWKTIFYHGSQLHGSCMPYANRCDSALSWEMRIKIAGSMPSLLALCAWTWHLACARSATHAVFRHCCVCTGMRIRLTRNLDKDRGFVNGAIGTIVTMLSECNFVLRTDRGILLPVHPISQDGAVFMPRAYGYALTICKSQGSTQGLVPHLHFIQVTPSWKSFAWLVSVFQFSVHLRSK